uniref:DOMON domain-containing protein n=1 Tax=Anopheles atroparvus TaxID=41427 RepID=A0A182JK01_ANOAO
MARPKAREQLGGQLCSNVFTPPPNGRRNGPPLRLAAAILLATLPGLLLLLLMVPAAESVAVATKLEPVHHRWSRSEAMDPNGLYTLEWHVDQKDIVFTATANTRGFMGLGFSHRSERMTGSDLVLVWVDDRTGKPNVLLFELPVEQRTAAKKLKEEHIGPPEKAVLTHHHRIALRKKLKPFMKGIHGLLNVQPEYGRMDSQLH